MSRIRSITKYSINDAIKTEEFNTDTVFIIANEIINSKGKVVRSYTVFESFNMFEKYRNKYPNCHEILVDHKNNAIDNSGRLVFDFDIKNDDDGNRIAPKDKTFKRQVENTIHYIINKYLINVDIEKIGFVWSSCDNSKKVSKHLTVKNLWLDNWAHLSKIFYKLFIKRWDKKYDWLKGKDIVDCQIIKKNTSLRMVGSCKIGGNILALDNDQFSFRDSLIRLYNYEDKKNEQKITKANFKDFKQYKDIDNNNIKEIDMVIYNDLKNTIVKKSNNNISNNNKGSLKPEIYNAIAEYCKNKFCNTFKFGKINGNFINLIRVKKSKCFISDKLHENENAYLQIYNGIYGILDIKYGCHRGCTYNDNKTVSLFILNSKTLEIIDS